MDFKSVDLLNAIRNTASAEFQSRVPLATQTNLSACATAILDYTPTRNEFVAALFDRIGLVILKDKMFNNPLAEFKAGTMSFGKDIEEVFVDLIKAQDYDVAVAESEVFKRNLPDIKSIFHSLNRKDMYKTTIEMPMLRQAFLGDDGFNGLVDKIINKLYVSDSYDEFLLTKSLIHKYGVEGKFKMVVVPPVTDGDSARVVMAKIKELSNDLTFMSTEYNYAGVTTCTPKEDQIILIDTKFDALVDVELLASAFNMSKADFTARRVLVDNFGGLTNVACAIVDRDWFMVYDNEISSDEIYNPQGKYYNYFLHHWQTLSTSQFANAILFVTVAPTVTGVTISNNGNTSDEQNCKKGDVIQLIAGVTGTNNPPSKVKWTIEDAEDSYITSTGLLVVGKNESLGEFIVNAISVYDDTKENHITFAVNG